MLSNHMLAQAASRSPCAAFRSDTIRHISTPKAPRRPGNIVNAKFEDRQQGLQQLQRHAATMGALTVMLLASPESMARTSSDARQTSGQGDLLNELLERNANSGVKALGPSAQKRFQGLSQNRLVSQSDVQTLTETSSETTNADSPLDKACGQVKALGKKAQQTTPRGSPTKPQPSQRAGPLEALKDLPQPKLQVASSEGSFKLEGPVGKGTQGYDFPDPAEAKQKAQAKSGQFFSSSPRSSAQAKSQEAAKAVGGKAAEAAPSGNSLLDSLLSKPQQAASAPAQKAKEAANAATETAKEAAKAKGAAQSSNPLTNLFSKPEAATDAAADKAKEAAPSSNPLKGFTSKPKQFSKAAPSKAKEAASAAADSAKEAAPSGNPLTSFLSKKPEQAAQSAKATAQESSSSSNPFSSLFTKPKQAADAAAGKSSKTAAKAADQSKSAENPLKGLLGKPQQATEKGKSGAQQAAGGAAAAAAAAAAANAVKGATPEAPSLPSPPSLPNPTEALKSSSSAASKVSLPDAPSLTNASQDSTALQQAAGLAAAEAIAALAASNIVGSLTAKKSGRKAYGK